MRTLKSLAKRIKLTARGKARFRRPGMSHNLTSKSRRRKRSLKRYAVASKPLARKVGRLLHA
jgi:large subunit ribosomal protein L35